MKTTATIRGNSIAVLGTALNSGYLRIYSGTKPTNADTALAGNTLLSTLRFGATAFGAPSAGAITANAITQDSSAAATGTATFARCFQSDGTTAVCDLTVGTSGQDLNLNSLSIVTALVVQCTSCVLTQPDGT
jgi:hypothetical protein